MPSLKEFRNRIASVKSSDRSLRRYVATILFCCLSIMWTGAARAGDFVQPAQANQLTDQSVSRVLTEVCLASILDNVPIAESAPALDASLVPNRARALLGRGQNVPRRAYAVPGTSMLFWTVTTAEVKSCFVASFDGDFDHAIRSAFAAAASRADGGEVSVPTYSDLQARALGHFPIQAIAHNFLRDQTRLQVLVGEMLDRDGAAAGLLIRMTTLPEPTLRRPR